MDACFGKNTKPYNNNIKYTIYVVLPKMSHSIFVLVNQILNHRHLQARIARQTSLGVSTSARKRFASMVKKSEKNSNKIHISLPTTP